MHFSTCVIQEHSVCALKSDQNKCAFTYKPYALFDETNQMENALDPGL